MRFLLLAATLAFTPILSAADAVPLSLADFTDTNNAAPSGGWSTDSDGTIHLVGKGGGSLLSKNEYENFVLEWEWKVAPGGNNGIKYWVTKVGGKEWLGIEYQMIDDEKHPDGIKGGSHTTASIYDIKEPAKDKAVKPAGEWNVSKIVVQDGKIEHWLNGSLAASADTKSPEWPPLIAASKFKNKEGFAPGKGRLMLTEHGDETWLRNIRLTANSTVTGVPTPKEPVSPTTSASSSSESIKRDAVVGRWRQKGATITTISVDGTAKNEAPGKPNYNGRWKRNGNEVEINWNDGLFVDRVIIRGGDELWKKDNSGGWSFLAKRLN